MEIFLSSHENNEIAAALSGVNALIYGTKSTDSNNYCNNAVDPYS